MQQVRTRTKPRRGASQEVPKEAVVIDYRDLLWSFQQHWRVITPVWAFLPAALVLGRLLGGVMSYSIVYWAFSLLFIGMFFVVLYRTYELVAEGRIPLAHWLVIVWIPWMPLAILSNAVISFLGGLLAG